MRTISSAVTRRIEMELNEGELQDLFKARGKFRSILETKDSGLQSDTIKALEDGIYLISTVLGNHE